MEVHRQLINVPEGFTSTRSLAKAYIMLSCQLRRLDSRSLRMRKAAIKHSRSYSLLEFLRDLFQVVGTLNVDYSAGLACIPHQLLCTGIHHATFGVGRGGKVV